MNYNDLNTMKINTLFIVLALALFACGGSNNNSDSTTYKDISSKLAGTANMHEVTPLEKIDAGGYTYLRVNEEGKEIWIAVSAREIDMNSTYLYNKAMEMTNFESKALNRTFDSIWFIQDFYSKAEVEDKEATTPHPGTSAASHTSGGKRVKISVSQDDNTIALEDFFEQVNNFEGKTVRIKAMVVKRNLHIMSKNWYHIQDGTAFNNQYDLTLTTDESTELNVGTEAVFEGKVALNKDFGAGYVYPVIMEETKVVY